MKKQKPIKTLLSFSFYCSTGFHGVHVKIYALTEKEARMRLKFIFTEKRDYILKDITEEIL